MAYLGLDLGTTGIKAAIFNVNGDLLASGLSEYSLLTPKPDIVELPPEQYLISTKNAILQALDKSGICSSEIKSVGITGQAETLVMLGKNGNPVRNAIVWLDNRATTESKFLDSKFGTENLFRMSGQTDMLPCWPAPKILWLKNNEPEIFEKTDKFLMVEDFIAFCLTGKFVTCSALLPSTLYYDIRTQDYCEEMLKTIGISRERLPSIFTPGKPMAVCKKNDLYIPEGAVVSVAPIDHVCGNLGSGSAEEGVISETTGCTLALCASFNRPVYDNQRRISTYHGFTENSYVLLPWAPTAGMLLKHFRDEFCEGTDFKELDNEAASVMPGSDGLLLLPHCAGSVSPICNPDAKGVAYGVTLAHKRAHWARAIMESVAYLLRDNTEVLKESGCNIHEIRCLGGASKSKLWLQIKADVLNVAVTVTKCEEATSLGAAILSAVAAGDFKTPQEAAKKMVQVEFTLTPSENAEKYDMLFTQYKRLNKLLMPTFGGKL